MLRDVQDLMRKGSSNNYIALFGLLKRQDHNGTTTEPACLEPVLRNKRGRDNERPAHCNEEWPPLATTRESPRTETKTQTQHSHK